ncbi:hypothetical protein [Bdellovibrio bacteriovorus]|uniref:hypothetical protein n=1 Tax=Bdellovibrio bacteriovorus TaxID=959 RepID=UPI0035A5A0BA
MKVLSFFLIVFFLCACQTTNEFVQKMKTVTAPLPEKTPEELQTESLAKDPYVQNNARHVNSEHHVLPVEMLVALMSEEYISGIIQTVARKNYDSQEQVAARANLVKKITAGKTCFMVFITSADYKSTMIDSWKFKFEKDQKFSDLESIEGYNLPSIDKVSELKYDFTSTHILCRKGAIARPFNVRVIDQRIDRELNFIWN